MTPTSNDLTRQQLEELDALLQRMLSAPPPSSKLDTSPPAISPPPIVESWRIDRPIPMPPRLHVDVPEVIEARAQPKSMMSSERITIPDEQFSTSEIHLGESYSANVPVTPSMPFIPIANPNETRPPEPIPPVPQSLIQEPEQAQTEDVIDDLIPLQSADTTTAGGKSDTQPQRIPVTHWPLFAVNWIIEESLKSFGADALTRPSAKMFLGILGIVLLIVSACWTVYVMR